MRKFTAAAIAIAAVAGFTTTTAATAQTRLSDTAYIKAARCAGLAGEDAAQFNELVKSNARGRASFVLDKAANAKSDAARQVRKADGEGAKAQIAAELAGACAGLAG